LLAQASLVLLLRTIWPEQLPTASLYWSEAARAKESLTAKTLFVYLLTLKMLETMNGTWHLLNQVARMSFLLLALSK
jgi:hypothetical protein